MLLNSASLRGIPVLSLHLGDQIAMTDAPVIDPNDLKVVAFLVVGGRAEDGNILDVKSVREFSDLGMIVDSSDEFINRGDVVRIDKVLDIKFSLLNKKVVSRKGSKIGRVIDYVIEPNSFQVIQLVVKRPTIKSFLDPELVISRSHISEVDDERVVIKDENEKELLTSEEEDFIPNFVNPFRKEQSFAPAHTQTPDEEDKQ